MAQPIVVRRGSVSVKIYRTRNGLYEHAELVYYRDGRRVREHLPSLAAAKGRADDVITLLTSGNTDVVGLGNADAATYRRALKLIEPTGRSLDQVVGGYMDALRSLGPSGATVAQAVEHFVAHQPEVAATTPEVIAELAESKRQDGIGPRHIMDLQNRLADFGGAFPGPIANITGSDIDRWLREQQEERKWQGLTRNHYRAAISNLMNYAAAHNYLPRDWNEMRVVGKAQVGQSPIEIYTPEEAKALMDAARRQHRPHLALALFAGIRQSEITRMNWRDIWWDQGLIHVGEQKIRTAGHRNVPLHPNCAAWLKPLAKSEGRICGTGIAHKILATGERAGVPWKHNAPRHSYISYRYVLLGLDSSKLAGEAGNTKQMIDRHYRKPITAEVARAYFEVMPSVS